MFLEAIQFPDINPFLFGPIDLGGFPLGVRWYSLAYIIGLVGGIWLAIRMVRRWGITVNGGHLDDLFIWFVLGVVLGGRLFFVLFYGLTTNPDAYASPLTWIAAWDGGMSFHGGMFGVALVVLIYGMTQPTVRTLELGDYVAAVAPIGLFLGRCANFINGELWGRPTDLPWGVLFPKAVIHDQGYSIPREESQVYPLFQSIVDSGGALIARHPSQLYEALFEGILLFIILQIMIRSAWIRARAGMVAGSFFLGYGVFRWSIEWVRQPDEALGILNILYPGATMGQLLSLPMILIGAALIAWALRTGPSLPGKAIA